MYESHQRYTKRDNVLEAAESVVVHRVGLGLGDVLHDAVEQHEVELDRTNDDSNDVASDFLSCSSAARSNRETFVISSSDASTHNGSSGEARARRPKNSLLTLEPPLSVLCAMVWYYRAVCMYGSVLSDRRRCRSGAEAIFVGLTWPEKPGFSGRIAGADAARADVTGRCRRGAETLVVATALSVIFLYALLAVSGAWG